MKKKVFKLVTKLYHTTDQGKNEGTMQRDLVTTCITENKKRFSQTRDTPLMHDRLIKVIGSNVEKEGGQKYWRVQRNTITITTLYCNGYR